MIKAQSGAEGCWGQLVPAAGLWETVLNKPRVVLPRGTEAGMHIIHSSLSSAEDSPGGRIPDPSGLPHTSAALLLWPECPQRASGVSAVKLSARVQDASTTGAWAGPWQHGLRLWLQRSGSIRPAFSMMQRVCHVMYLRTWTHETLLPPSEMGDFT